MADQETSNIKIHATLVEKINFACHQSAFAVLRELRIENLDEERAISAHRCNRLEHLEKRGIALSTSSSSSKSGRFGGYGVRWLKRKAPREPGRMIRWVCKSLNFPVLSNGGIRSISVI